MDTVKTKGTRLSTVGQRLKEERERLGMSQVAFGALAGIQKNAQVNYEANRRSPDGSYFTAIAAAGVDILYVLTGRRDDGLGRLIAEADGSAYYRRKIAEISALELGSDSASDGDDQDVADLAEFAPIPVLAAELAAGAGAENGQDQVIDHLAFRRTWLKGLGISPLNAVIARARGDSMWPTIHAGDIVLIDLQAADPPRKPRDPADRRPAPIYALRDDCGARIKRVVLAASGTLALLSDNPASPPEFRTPEDVVIIGRVRWWGHTDKE